MCQIVGICRSECCSRLGFLDDRLESWLFLRCWPSERAEATEVRLWLNPDVLRCELLESLHGYHGRRIQRIGEGGDWLARYNDTTSSGELFEANAGPRVCSRTLAMSLAGV